MLRNVSRGWRVALAAAMGVMVSVQAQAGALTSPKTILKHPQRWAGFSDDFSPTWQGETKAYSQSLPQVYVLNPNVIYTGIYGSNGGGLIAWVSQGQGSLNVRDINPFRDYLAQSGNHDIYMITPKQVSTLDLTGSYRATSAVVNAAAGAGNPIQSHYEQQYDTSSLTNPFDHESAIYAEVVTPVGAVLANGSAVAMQDSSMATRRIEAEGRISAASMIAPMMTGATSNAQASSELSATYDVQWTQRFRLDLSWAAKGEAAFTLAIHDEDTDRDLMRFTQEQLRMFSPGRSGDRFTLTFTGKLEPGNYTIRFEGDADSALSVDGGERGGSALYDFDLGLRTAPEGRAAANLPEARLIDAETIEYLTAKVVSISGTLYRDIVDHPERYPQYRLTAPEWYPAQGVAGSTIIPEPAGVAGLGVLALAMMRRRAA
ncbi:MAG: hypothetical protein IT442_02085 [Phycisphaeraceae bacterium]|nr:hypothetical protein [Phycisphaeraceae bacterium]